MTKITSKQNRKTIWFSVLFSAIFFAALASFLIYIFIKDWPLNNHKIKTYLLPVFSFFTYYLGFSYVKNYYQKSRKIVVDKEKITIGPKVYFWKDVKRIILTGKKGFGFFSYQMEVSTLVFNDNQTLFIFDDMYSNSWEIKLFIKQIVVDKKESFEIINSRIRSNEIENENFQEFKGNPIFSFRGIMMWSLILCCIYVILLTDSKLSKFNQLKIYVPFSIFWFLLNVFSMNYFEKSKNFFVVKNHYFFLEKENLQNFGH
ncbi:hypothetical protein [Epilithonimonas lactis]|uniref:Uncharacterized protein n=1 Tax=Epilithonimonas lactis TaxID=421072 RepID=A0A085BET5_9FLAO|nr:hypothetical protein [Epilithonimonas lactis]KFC20980.1 hypothetical protein IO89_12190 [Epilithonimonas lactis]